MAFGVRDSGGGGDELYPELWRACAGPLVEIPRLKERVYYFPQGHMEQLEASTNEELNERIHMFNLPSKILCRVMDITLLAEKETDEVYAQITLMPETDQTEPTKPDPCLPESPRSVVRSFSKVLTASDTSTHGGFSVLRKHANECLPPLDMTQQTPTQELAAEDLHGYVWRFKHIFRGQPRRHLLTTGWSHFVTSKRVAAGDSFVFLRGDNGKLRIGVRRVARQQSNMSTSVISSQSMHLGVLATASHAVTTHTYFVVYYKPRMSQFIIGLNKYLESVNHGSTVGMRFKMRFEGEDTPERSSTVPSVLNFTACDKVRSFDGCRLTHVLKTQRGLRGYYRFTGTIVGVDDLSTQWKDSRWRSLKVQWDEPTSILRPDRVSPWEIEPFGNSPSLDATDPVIKNKKPRPSIDIPSRESLSINDSTPWNSSIEVVQSEVGDRKAATEWSVFSGYATPKSSKQSQNQTANEKKSETTASYRLFGIDLMKPSMPISTEEEFMPDLNGTKDFAAEQGHSSVSAAVSEQKSDLSKVVSLRELSKQGSSARSRTKVQLQGVAVGRAVDLMTLKGYDQLIDELEELFDIQGELRPRNKWEVVFTDDEGDMMLVGDDPWPEFCYMAKKLYICSSQELKKMSPGSKLHSSSLEGDGTVLSFESSGN